MSATARRRSRTFIPFTLGVAALTAATLMAQAPPAAPTAAPAAAATPATPASAKPFLGDWTLTLEAGTLGLRVDTEGDRVVAELGGDALPIGPVSGVTMAGERLAVAYNFPYEGNQVSAVLYLTPAATTTRAATLDLAGGALTMQGTAARRQGPAPAAAPAGQRAGGPGRGRGASPLEPDFSPKPPVLPLSPAEEQARFRLPPGFRLEPVLTEPH